MRRVLLLSLALGCMVMAAYAGPQVITGAEQVDLYLPQLKEKRIALVANQTSTINAVHLVDTLLGHGITLQKLFAPEHGFRGNVDAGQHIADTVDKRTHLSIISLYQKNKKIMQAMLADVDCVVFDIQDVGVRFFTYISTLHEVMEACAIASKPFILLDRPNPHAGYIDGPVLDKEFQSFVGMHPIPIVYGLTIGELALMINGEGWLGDGLQCNLTVIPLKHYTHQTPYSLPINPSPNLPNDQAIALYPCLGLFEGTIVSMGRGTAFPFQVIGYPDARWGSFTFTPVGIPGKAATPKYQDKTCFGRDVRSVPPVRLIRLDYLLQSYKLATEQGLNFFEASFDAHAGTKLLRQQIQAGWSEESIRASWQNELDNYKKLRKKYLLYP